MNRIIQMIIRMVLLNLVRKGVNGGISHFMNKKSKTRDRIEDDRIIDQEPRS